MYEFLTNQWQPMVVVDGPEKAGKSTLIAEIARVVRQEYRLRPMVIHFNRPTPSRDHYHVLYEQWRDFTVNPSNFYIWDRSQASELVYSTLLNRKSDLTWSNVTYEELLYGRIQQSLGPRVMLLGPSAEENYLKRDETDLDTDPELERELFASYGQYFQWQIVERVDRLTHFATYMVHQAITAYRRPHIITGPPGAYDLLVQASRSEDMVVGSLNASLISLVAANITRFNGMPASTTGEALYQKPQLAGGSPRRIILEKDTPTLRMVTYPLAHAAGAQVTTLAEMQLTPK